MKNILHLHQHNLKTYDPTARNIIVHSELKHFASFNQSARVSVKYVHSGTEHYQINQKRHDVTAGEFLIVKEHSEIGIELDEELAAEGFCFFMEETYIHQALALARSSNSILFDIGIQDDIDYNFLETKYRSQESEFGRYLASMAQLIKTDTEHYASEDFFLHFTTKLLAHQFGVHTDVASIRAAKQSTREELYKRVKLAKTYLEDHVDKKVSIKALSQIAGLSEVQLHRCFKQLYQLTPYQYQTKTKMEYGLRLIQSNQHSLTEVSMLCGFADLPTFSKCFKKYFGQTPSACVRF